MALAARKSSNRAGLKARLFHPAAVVRQPIAALMLGLRMTNARLVQVDGQRGCVPLGLL